MLGVVLLGLHLETAYLVRSPCGTYGTHAVVAVAGLRQSKDPGACLHLAQLSLTRQIGPWVRVGGVWNQSIVKNAYDQTSSAGSDEISLIFLWIARRLH